MMTATNQAEPRRKSGEAPTTATGERILLIEDDSDISELVLEYRPDRSCIESKSLKLYLWSFRDRKVFCEALAAEIAEEVVRAADPHEVTVTLTQQPRGGIVIEATAHRER